MQTILFDEFKISRWAFYYCKDINDDPEIRKITVKNMYKDINYDFSI